MARTPIQVQGRGASAVATIGNRAQYLRPAKDNQNSRMLAKAFSQINSAFSAYNKNQAALQNRMMADDLNDAKAHQREVERIAGIQGEIAGLTGQDRTSAFVNNEQSLKVYNENRALGAMSASFIEIEANIQNMPGFGDPNSTAFLEGLDDALAGSIGGSSGGNNALAAVGTVQALKFKQRMVAAHEAAAETRMLHEENLAIGARLTAGVLSASDGTEATSILQEITEGAFNTRGVGGLSSVVDAVNAGFDRMLMSGDQVAQAEFYNKWSEVLEAGDNGQIAALQGFNADQQRSILSNYRRAFGNFQAQQSARAERQQEERQVLVNGQVRELTAQVLATGEPLNRTALVDEYGYDTAIAIEERVSEYVSFIREGDHADPEDLNAKLNSDTILRLSKSTIDRLTADGSAQELSDYVNSALNDPRLTRAAKEEIANYQGQVNEFYETDGYQRAQVEIDRLVTQQFQLIGFGTDSYSGLNLANAQLSKNEIKHQVMANLDNILKANIDDYNSAPNQSQYVLDMVYQAYGMYQSTPNLLGSDNNYTSIEEQILEQMEEHSLDPNFTAMLSNFGDSLGNVNLANYKDTDAEVQAAELQHAMDGAMSDINVPDIEQNPETRESARTSRNERLYGNSNN